MPKSRRVKKNQYIWAAPGDVNAFFGLMLDNIAGLVLTVGMLASIFQFPVDFSLRYMVPGTAIGVLVGDLLFFWLAFRYAKQTGKTNVTDYDQKFLAIHGLNQFYEKISRIKSKARRPGAPRPEGRRAPRQPRLAERAHRGPRRRDVRRLQRPPRTIRMTRMRKGNRVKRADLAFGWGKARVG